MATAENARQEEPRQLTARELVRRLKKVRPTGSYVLPLPEGVHEERDGGTSSFWMDGKPLLLQLSSYIRTEGEPVSALGRLKDRMAKFPQKWVFTDSRLHPDPSLDQAAAEAVDRNGILWLHAYLVWPHLTIYVTLSGPESDVRDSTSWAYAALREVRLAVH